ncbi:MAG: hypothetical protein J6U23_12235 [Clostridiales bacterium]|nr:hypothetical protein [Clostridiales bacterium]
MKQNNNDNFDKMMESVMKKNLGSVHASQDLINKTLLKINEEKNKPQQEQKESKKKPFIIPIAFVSGLAALLIALVGVSVMFFSFNKAKDGTKNLSTKKAATDAMGEADSEDMEVKQQIEAVEAVDSFETVAEDIEEDDDSSGYLYAGNSKGDTKSLDGYGVITNYYTDDQVAVGKVATDEAGSFGSGYYNGYTSSEYTSPFDSLNNYYYSIQDKVWDSEITQGNMKDTIKNPDFINPENKTNS